MLFRSVVIVRYDNLDGNVAEHLFIESGSSGLICLPTGTFQVFSHSPIHFPKVRI